MKKLFIFILLIIFVSKTTVVFAQTISPSTTPIPTPTSMSTDYQLAYPGLLPDNPLYIIKVVRDRIVSFFISDPLKKAEFDLLQADKRLFAGMLLLQEKGNRGQKEQLAFSVISKGENYFEQGVAQLAVAKKHGENIGEIGEKMKIATSKHIEELNRLLPMVSHSVQLQIMSEIKRVKKFQNTVMSLLLLQ